MPGVANPAGMTVSYNNYTFPVSMQPPNIAISPVYDSSGRVVVACRYTISLTAIIYTGVGDQDTAVAMGDLRQRLSAPAAELNIIGTGFSDFIVNRANGRVWDCEWGPKPQVVECVQIGDNQAWRITWRCVTVLPEECPEETRPTLQRTYEWCYSVRWNIDQHGLTTRTVSGHVMIPLTRLRPLAINGPDRSADDLREVVKKIVIPEGFRRIPGESLLSEDRRRLEFSLVDQQMSSPYSPPPGVILCSGRHDQTNSVQFNFVKYQHRISASYTVGRDVPKSSTMRHFLDMVIERWNAARKNAGLLIIPLNFSASEELWSQTTSYQMAYVSVPKEPLKDNLDTIRAFQSYVLRGGMWAAPVKTTWLDWKNSLENTALHPRGYANLGYDTKDDQLINVCVFKEPSLDALDAPPAKFGGNPKGDRDQDTKVLPPEAFGPDPNLNAENSWLRYHLRLNIREIDSVANFKLLRDQEVKYQPQERGLEEKGPFPLDYKATNQSPHVFQFRAEPTYEVTLEGDAARVAYPIVRPILISVGGVPAFPVRSRDDYFEQEVIGNFLTPIVAAKWRSTYILEGTPKKGIGPPDNPMFGAAVGRSSGDNLEGFTVLG